MIESILGRVSAGENLSMDEMAEAIDATMSGNCTEPEIAMLLTALGGSDLCAQETTDTPAEATARDLAEFDRQLAGEAPDLSGYLASPGRITARIQRKKSRIEYVIRHWRKRTRRSAGPVTRQARVPRSSIATSLWSLLA